VAESAHPCSCGNIIQSGIATRIGPRIAHVHQECKGFGGSRNGSESAEALEKQGRDAIHIDAALYRAPINSNDDGVIRQVIRAKRFVAIRLAVSKVRKSRNFATWWYGRFCTRYILYKGARSIREQLVEEARVRLTVTASL
jgi:hypothetical protein